MERISFAFTIVLLALLFTFAEKGNAGREKQHFVFGNSNYTFHGKHGRKLTWEESNKDCIDTGSQLVSIESKKEWEFLKNKIQNMTTGEYYIGLKKDSESGDWRWISDNSKANATQGEFPWATGEPSGDGNCAIMYKKYQKNNGKFNDLPCVHKKFGHICEISGFADSTGQEATTVGQTSLAVTSAARLTTSYRPSTEAKPTEATQPTESGTKESATKPSMTQSTPSIYFLTESNSEATPPKNIMKDVPPEETTKNNTKVMVIVLVLLAILILITLIVFYVIYVRRRKFKKQVQSRVRCTYKKPSSPGRQSVEHGRHLDSSAAEVTVHVTLSRTKAGLDTYETVEVQEGPTYANVKQTKSQTQREEPLTHEDGTAKQTQSEDGYCMPLESSPLDATNKLQAHGVENAEKQENKDHVYAVVHKDAKGRDSAASVHARTSCSKRLEPAICPYSDIEPVNRSSSADPANQSDAKPSSMEPANHSQGALLGDEKKDYLYAVVDKGNKKKRPPQKPSPYRGLVYADLNHSTTSNTGPIKREFPTVYADIDYLKTDASSKLPEEHLDQPTE